MKRYKLALAALAVMAVLSLVALPSSNAASTISNTTYVVNGREVPVGFDPISLKSGLLLPQVFLEETGVTITESPAGVVTVSRGSLSIVMRVGSKFATANSQNAILAEAPVKLSGQLYLPEDALVRLGIHLTSDGGYLFVEPWPQVEGTPDLTRYTPAVRTATQERVITVARDTNVLFQVVRLDEDIIKGQPWTNDPSVRGRTLELLQGSLIFQVTITNTSDKIQTFGPGSYYLVDDIGNQYTLTTERVALTGDLFASLAPAAKASGLLVYPAKDPAPHTLSLYVQTSTDAQLIGVYTQR